MNTEIIRKIKETRNNIENILERCSNIEFNNELKDLQKLYESLPILLEILERENEFEND